PASGEPAGPGRLVPRHGRSGSGRVRAAAAGRGLAAPIRPLAHRAETPVRAQAGMGGEGVQRSAAGAAAGGAAAVADARRNGRTPGLRLKAPGVRPAGTAPRGPGRRPELLAAKAA